MTIRLLPFILIVVLLGATQPHAPAAAQPTGDPGSWKLTFDDEFSGTALDLSKWTPNWFGSTAHAISNPVTTAEDSCYDPALQSQPGAGDEDIALATRSCTTEAGLVYPHASTIISTYGHYTFTHGFAEARIFVPGNGHGATADWPSFWLDGTGIWPTTGEIDVFEGLHGDDSYHFHYGSPSHPRQFGRSSALHSGWHTFGVEWKTGSLRWFYDGKLVGSTKAHVTNSPMFLVAGLGAVATSAVTAPAVMKIDYVRVWQ